MIVIDASVAVAWSFEDERHPPIDEVLTLVANEGGVAPAIWLVETANAIQMAMRRGRIGPAYRDQLLVQLNALPVEIEASTGELVIAAASVSDRFGITVYDATYLEVAVRRQLPLATLDRQLAAAARSAGVAVLP